MVEALPRAGKERIMELVTTAPLTNLHLLPRFVCQLRNFCKVNLDIWEIRWGNGFKGLFKADKTLSGCVIVAHYVRRWIIQPDNTQQCYNMQDCRGQWWSIWHWKMQNISTMKLQILKSYFLSDTHLKLSIVLPPRRFLSFKTRSSYFLLKKDI